MLMRASTNRPYDSDGVTNLSYPLQPTTTAGITLSGCYFRAVRAETCCVE
jgi:hypothetical protein